MLVKMRTSAGLALIGVVLVFTISAVSQQKGGGDETGPYDVVESWPQPVCGPGYQRGSVGGVFAETPDRVFVFQRGCLPALPAPGSFWGVRMSVPTRDATASSLTAERPELRPRWDHNLMILDREGKLVESWDQHNHLFVRPHRVLMDPYDTEKHVWLVDDGAQQIWKLTHDGKRIVMTLGEHGVAGNDQTHFNRPTDIVWLPNGEFFVSDGYVNTRVVKFSKDGKYLLEWGKPGKGPGEFNTVHGIAIDSRRRIYVTDRGNARVQVFDENGKFLDQ